MTSQLQAAAELPGCPLSGRHVSLRPVDPAADAAALYQASHDPQRPRLWDYMGSGPFEDEAAFRSWLEWGRSEPWFHAITPTGDPMPCGMAAFMRIKPVMATIEIGHIWFGARLMRTAAATEAIFLMIDHAFELGYRRVEWKCDADNAASRRAADRFGFTFEGVFRQHMIVKGRNRDTAWFAILDHQWPSLSSGYRGWLDPENFDQQGQQRRTLGDLLAATD